jgi:hypothetical protein
MEKKLKDNDFKNSYRSCRASFLFFRLAQEYQEFLDEIKPWGYLTGPEDIEITEEAAWEIIDFMNFAMMLLTKWEGFKDIDLGLDPD